MTSLLLSIDVGTSGVRAALFDESGSEVPGAQVRIRRDAAGPDFGELDPDQLVDEVIRAIDELLAQDFHAAASIEFIAISAFWHSLIGVDANGLP
jgi:gluconokinase